MPTIARRKPTRSRKSARKAMPVRRRAAKTPEFVLSPAEIDRINGAEESFASMP